MKAEGLNISMSRIWSEPLWRSGVRVSLGGVDTTVVEMELKGARLDCTVVRNLRLLNAQSINGLWRASQLCPKTMAQEPSNGVT